MPATLGLYMIGALSISGAPLLSGFVSKAMIVAAAEAEHRAAVAWLLHLASVGTFLHTGLKLPYFTFGGPARGARPAPVPRAMLAAMTATAALCALIGAAPGLLYAMLPFPVTWQPYTVSHVMETLQLLAGTAVGFVLLRAGLGGEPTVSLDADRLYRAVGRWLGSAPALAASRAAAALEAVVLAAVEPAPWPRARAFGYPVGLALLVALGALGAGLGLYALR
jgi:multicomponent Na+:H+ antiporter subunit D